MLEEAPASQTMDTKLERDGLKMAVDPLAAGSLQGAKQQIAPRMFFFSKALLKRAASPTATLC